MEPVATAITVNEVLVIVGKLAPLINGIWVLLSVLLLAAITGAIWVTNISTAVKANASKIVENSNASANTVDPSICLVHREACDKAHTLEFTSITATLIKIEAAISKINERHERYQETLLRRAQGADIE